MNKIKRGLIKKRMAYFTRFSLIVIFIGVIVYSLYQIFDTNNNYIKEEKVRQQMARFKPAPNYILNTDVISEDNKTIIFNQSIADAQQLNSDIVGWITLDNTRIDYPFVKTTDNDFYLHSDVNKNYSYAGTIFMDYKCSDDFSGFSGILYGHNMKNSTMFSDIRRYDNAEFFDNNQTGTLFLVNATYNIEIFAYMLVRSDDNIIYSIEYTDNSDKQRLLTYIEQNALRFRNTSVTTDDKLLVLSTCTYDFDKARSVLIARLVN